MRSRTLAIFLNLPLALASFTKNVVRVHPQSYDADLTNFVTRPEIKVPILDVIEHQPGTVAPGYFFVAPYGRYFQEQFPKSYYQPCQTGPTIYDAKGNLVWTGACQFWNQNTADFRPNYYNGSWHLSAIYTDLDETSSWNIGRGFSDGHGFVLDGTYREESTVNPPKAADNFVPREFLIAKNGQSAISILSSVEYVDVSMIEEIERDGGWVLNMGFREVDILSGESLFEWWALDHIPLTEGKADSGGDASSLKTAWDYFDLVSVDKSAQGHYLVSAWQTSTIYSISARDGSVNWRLGGKNSTFTHEVAFTAQRDVRSLSRNQITTPSPLEDDDETEYLSFIADLGDPSPDESADPSSHPSSPSALIISLSHRTKTARIIRQIPRPDVTYTFSHGNFQHLPPNNNLLVSLGGDAPVTEHNADGSTAMSARFRSDRFVTYRVYKSEFVAFPDETEIVIECSAYGTSEAKATTVCHVSWNGATEVRSWRFRAQTEGREGDVIGTVEKAGFETRVMRQMYIPSVRVEGLNGNGAVLGTSKTVEVRVMQPWPQRQREAGGSAGGLECKAIPR